MQRPIQLLAVVPDEWLIPIRETRTSLDIAISLAHDRQSAISQLGMKPEIEVVLTASMLPDGTWKDLLSDILHLPRPPQVVVAAQYGDSSLWCEVLDNGGYDLAAYPFKSGALQHTLISAAIECQLKRNLEDTAARYNLGR
jgi:DNA-binding NtrC family response regulator